MISKNHGVLVVVTVLFLFNLNHICHCHSHDHFGHDHSHDEPPHFKYSREANEKLAQTTHYEKEHLDKPLAGQNLWLHAMCSTLLISAAPFFILFFVPLENTDSQQPLLKVLLAFASGGLLGDAFLHLIPHAAMSVEEGNVHSHSHSHGSDSSEHSHDMSVGLWVLAGIVSFLIVEKIVRIIKGKHSHSHAHKKDNDDGKEQKSKPSSDAKKNKKKSDDKQLKPTKEIKVAGYLNLVADFCHNFTDGLAIGSSYLAGNTVGLVTTITILLHEVPHEIGDFAILLQSGVSRKNAMLLQLTTAVGAMAGTALSLLTHNALEGMATSWILPFTAGGFIYIALVSVIPELLDEEKPSLKQTVLQLAAMLSGVYMMVLIAAYE